MADIRIFKPVLAAMILPACLYGAMTGAAFGQIQTGQLSDASAYDISLLPDGAPSLDSALWSDTAAPAAAQMVKSAPLRADGAPGRLARAAVLSGGVPPYAADRQAREEYLGAKMDALLNAYQFEAFDALAFSVSARPAQPEYSMRFARKSLLANETEAACLLADTQTEDRKKPFWAKLRAFCHVQRGEIPAAELTIDILRRSGHQDQKFFSLLGNLTGSAVKLPKLNHTDTALNTAVLRAYFKSKGISKSDLADIPPVLAAEIAQDPNAPKDIRLAALKRAADILPNGAFAQILQNAVPAADSAEADNAEAGLAGIAAIPDITGPDMTGPDLDADWTLADWARAYAALPYSQDSAAQAGLAAAMLSKAEGSAMAGPVERLLLPVIRAIPAQALTATDPARFARLAARQRDLGALRGLYDALPEDHALRPRIALASDAIGGAFNRADLGTDIETRLGADGEMKNRAIRDSYIAAALGSRLSGGAADILSDVQISKGKPAMAGDMLALRSAAKRGAKAETALRAAHILHTVSIEDLRIDSLSGIIFALSDAGMGEQAGLLAAQDFLSGDYDLPALTGAP